jgi:uncharacterized protein YceH (UPF0502 family)
MQTLLTEEEARALGALVEKSVTTPEYYPLSLNALKNACNQKSSRDPVVDYDEPAVARALEGLREKHLVWFVDSADSRVQKYRHRFAEAFDLSEEAVALLDILLLRGPQTPGELRGRSDRLHRFEEVDEVEVTLQALSAREESPLVARLPRQPGRKEHRWTHTLCGAVEPAAADEAAVARQSPAFDQVRSDRHRMAAVEAELQTLKQEVQSLREELKNFRRQFE